MRTRLGNVAKYSKQLVDSFTMKALGFLVYITRCRAAPVFASRHIVHDNVIVVLFAETSLISRYNNSGLRAGLYCIEYIEACITYIVLL